MVNGDGRHLPFRSDIFDLTYSFKTLPHIANVHLAIGEMHRVTKPGGHVILEFYNSLNVRRFFPYKYYTEYHTPWQARALVATHALKIKKIYGAGTTMHLNAVCQIPGIFEAIRWIDGRLATTWLNNFSAFYIVVSEKMRIK